MFAEFNVRFRCIVLLPKRGRQWLMPHELMVWPSRCYDRYRVSATLLTRQCYGSARWSDTDRPRRRVSGWRRRAAVHTKVDGLWIFIWVVRMIVPTSRNSGRCLRIVGWWGMRAGLVSILTKPSRGTGSTTRRPRRAARWNSPNRASASIPELTGRNVQNLASVSNTGNAHVHANEIRNELDQ